MFLRNFTIALALLNAVKAFPAEKPSQEIILEKNKDNVFSTLPLLSIFKPIIELFPSLADIGPKIEIGDKYTNIIIKADQYKPGELTVEVKGKYVTIEGSKKTTHDDRDLASEFLYTASLPLNANTSDVFAMLYSDNYLVVTTPTKGLNTDVAYVDRIVPITVSDDEYIKTSKNDNKVEVTTVSSEATEDITILSTTPVALVDPITTTTVPEITTEAPVTNAQETEEITVESFTPESLETSFDITTPSISLEEKEAKTETEEQTTPYIEEVTQNTTPYIENEISELESVTYSK